MSAAPPPVLVCCDVGPELGVGHLMRCLALAEELVARGHAVTFAADAASVPWTRELLRVRGLGLVPPPADPAAAAALVARLEARLVVVDTYRLPWPTRHALRSAAPVLVAVVDGPAGGASSGPVDPVTGVGWEADVEVDQNLGGPTGRDVVGRTVRLRGPAYALLRDEVRAAAASSVEPVPSSVEPVETTGPSSVEPAETTRPSSVEPVETTPGPPPPPRVLAFLGGTDPAAATPLLVRRLVATGRPFEATVVAPDAAGEEVVSEVRTGPGQRVRVIGPTSRLPRLAAGSDLVLCAAGTSLLELLHLGVAAAVVQVVDNQARGYDALTAAGVVVGLGRVADLVDDRAGSHATRLLARLLDDPGWRGRLRAAGPALVDGHGRERVADEAHAALQSLLEEAGRRA